MKFTTIIALLGAVAATTSASTLYKSQSSTINWDVGSLISLLEDHYDCVRGKQQGPFDRLEVVVNGIGTSDCRSILEKEWQKHHTVIVPCVNYFLGDKTAECSTISFMMACDSVINALLAHPTVDPNKRPDHKNDAMTCAFAAMDCMKGQRFAVQPRFEFPGFEGIEIPEHLLELGGYLWENHQQEILTCAQLLEQPGPEAIWDIIVTDGAPALPYVIECYTLGFPFNLAECNYEGIAAVGAKCAAKIIKGAEKSQQWPITLAAGKLIEAAIKYIINHPTQ